MTKRVKSEYQAKVIDDRGLTRSRVPTPVLNAMGARPGDSVIFRLTDRNEAIMHVSRLKGVGKSAKVGRARSGKKGRRM